MKTYHWTEATVEDASDEWVPADVAQELYDALSDLLEKSEGFSVSSVYFTEFKENEESVIKAWYALSKADGED